MKSADKALAMLLAILGLLSACSADPGAAAAFGGRSDRDIVLHCSSANRVSAWYAIYLVQQQGVSIEEALRQARATGLIRAALEQRIEDYLGES